MIIITDGENHEDDPLSAAEKASGLGIVIHTIGIGSTDGVPVPVINNGKRDYLKDNEGNTVISRLDEKVLQDIAAVTGGSYVRASNASIGLEEIFTGIKRMDTDELESTMYTEYNDQFRIFAVLSLILLFADFMVMDRKNRKLVDIRLFRFKI
jgi:Ca-activated chloride channel family protein